MDSCNDSKSSGGIFGKKIKDIKETYLHGDYYYGLGAIIGGSYLIGAKVMTETGKFLEQAPNLYSGFSEEFQEVEHNLRSIIKELPDNVQVSIDNTQEELGKEIGTIISTVSELTVDYAGNIAKNLPNALISTILRCCRRIFSLLTEIEFWNLDENTLRK